MIDKLAGLQKLDIFGVAPAIQFRGESKSYSHFGLIYTVLTGAFVIWSIVFTSQDFVHRTNPAVVTTTLFGETFHDDLILNHELFQLGFGIYENKAIGNYFMDPSVFTVSANMGTYNYYPDGTGVLTFKPLDIEPCQNSNFDNQINYYSSQWCLSMTQTNFDYLYTRTEDDQFIQIDFYFCNNSTSGGTCASQEVINKLLIESDIQTTFRQSTTIATNNKEPITHFYTDQWQGLLLDKTKSVKLMLDVVEFTSDDGWLFQSENTETIMNFNPIAADVFDRREPDLFGTFIIANSGNKIIYHRTYQKIQDVLAQVSGLAGVAALILGFLAQPYAELKMYEKIVREIYKVQVDKKSDDSPDQIQSQKVLPKIDVESQHFSRSSIQKTSNPPFNLKITPIAPLEHEDFFSVSQNPLNDQDLPKENEKTDPVENVLSIDLEKGEAIAEEKFHSNIGYFQWLLSHVRFSTQISLLKKGRDEINRYLDLMVMVKKLREVDKLKVCLMKKEERVLFENSQQPTLSINTTSKPRKVEVQECYLPSETSESRKIDKAYYRVRNSRYKTDFAEKLLMLYERDQRKPSSARFNSSLS